MIVLFTVAILFVSAIGQNVYAGGMSLSVDCSGSTCDVSGTSDRDDLDVAMILKSGNGIHGVAQATVSGGSYSASFNVSNLNDGTYTIEANQSVSSTTGGAYVVFVDVDVSGGTSDSSVSVSTQAVASDDAPEAAATVTAGGGLSLTAGGIEGSTTIDVSGTTDRYDDITLTITAPNGNIVGVSQITPSDGSFATTITTGGALWSQDGLYTIKAVQGTASNYQVSAEVEVIDGHVIPEFGVIAAMILAVAIVSIIVVTAKTRLSIVPRY